MKVFEIRDGFGVHLLKLVERFDHIGICRGGRGTAEAVGQTDEAHQSVEAELPQNRHKTGWLPGPSSAVAKLR